MLAETAKFVTELTLADKMSAGLKKATGNLGRLDGAAQKTGRGLRVLGVGAAALAAGIATGIGVAVSRGIDALVKLEEATAQTEAVVKSTGGAAKVTAADVRTLAESLEDLTTIDDKVIQSAANMMLTFTNVRNEAGKGNDIFNQSIAVLADMSTALGQDMSQSAIQLGKALNDPVAGITALKRVGVTFDAAQMKLIKTLVKEGKVLDAQKIILAELNKEFGGSAAAQADTYAGKMRRLNDAVEGLQMGLAEALLPALSEVSTEINTFLRDPAVMEGVKSFGRDLAKGFREGVIWAKKLPWDQIGSALTIAAGAAKTLIGAFTSMPAEAQAAIIALAGLNKITGGAVTGIVGELGKGLIKGVLGINAAVVNLNAAKVIGGGGGLPGGGKGPGGLPAAAPAAAGFGAAGAGTLAAGIGAVLAMNLLPYLFQGPKGSSGPTLETNTNPAFATTAVLNSLAQSMTATQKATIGVRDRVSDVSADIRNGFTVQTSAIKNGFTTQTAGASRTSEIIRNGFNVQQTKLSDVARVTAAGDERASARIASMDSAVTGKLGTVAGAVNTTTSVLRSKNFSPRITVPVSVTTNVSVRAVTQQQRTVARYTGGSQTSRTIL